MFIFRLDLRHCTIVIVLDGSRGVEAHEDAVWMLWFSLMKEGLWKLR